MNRFYGLDVGTAKVAFCGGGVDKNGQLTVNDAVIVRSMGVQKGMISNVGEAAGCIEEAVRRMQQRMDQVKPTQPGRRSDIRSGSVFLSISGEHVLGGNSQGMVPLGARPREIARRDIRRVLETLRFSSLSLDREILHVLPQEFTVDGYRRIKEPLGIFATRLAVSAHLISVSSSFLNSLIKAVNLAGLEVEEVIFSGLATSRSVLTKDETDAGVVLLDIGAGAINLIFFKDGLQKHTSVIPWGGQDITREIARELAVDEAQAEQLKLQYQGDLLDYEEEGRDGEKIIIRRETSAYKSIQRGELVKLIKQAQAKVLSEIKREIELAGILKQKPFRIVISGGMSFMGGVSEELEAATGLPVRIGTPKGFISSVSGLNSIFYSTAIGLMMQGIAGKAEKAGGRQPSALARLIDRFRWVYEDYF